ncbi:MAG: DUF2087 domain-containing protein [Acidimicrobiales bacterium]
MGTRPLLDARRLVGLLAEDDRRRVVAALILDAGDAEAVARATGLELRAVVDALERLRAAGLVEVGADGVNVVLEGAFRSAARAEAAAAAPAPGPGTDGPAGERERLLARCFVDGRLVHLPRRRAKRLIVLDALAQEFDPGVHYGERQVNAVLRRFDDDVATLRRYLVDEHLLDRAGGEYWRAGGTVELD